MKLFFRPTIFNNPEENSYATSCYKPVSIERKTNRKKIYLQKSDDFALTYMALCSQAADTGVKVISVPQLN